MRFDKSRILHFTYHMFVEQCWLHCQDTEAAAVLTDWPVVLKHVHAHSNKFFKKKPGCLCCMYCGWSHVRTKLRSNLDPDTAAVLAKATEQPVVLKRAHTHNEAEWFSCAKQTPGFCVVFTADTQSHVRFSWEVNDHFPLFFTLPSSPRFFDFSLFSTPLQLQTAHWSLLSLPEKSLGIQ